jgi:hypothetical protein
VNTLNAADLVIVSRSVNSASFQAASADNWNTKVTVPVIYTSAWTMRKSRMGFVTASNNPTDITASMKLTVNDVNSPIFAGVSLTDGTMDANYAGIAVYPDATNAFGISISTDSLDPNGTVIAKAAAGSAPAGVVGFGVIVEWKAGAKLVHDGGALSSVLAGRRLILLTGSRENNSKSSESAGMFDLTPDGSKVFLNAARYMMGISTKPAAPAETK